MDNSARLKPKRSEKLRLFQKGGETFGTVDEKSFIALPDVLLAALALADGKNTLDDIAYHLIKNTAMPKESMVSRLSSVFQIMELNGFVTMAGRKRKKAKR